MKTIYLIYDESMAYDMPYLVAAAETKEKAEQYIKDVREKEVRQHRARSLFNIEELELLE